MVLVVVAVDIADLVACGPWAGNGMLAHPSSASWIERRRTPCRSQVWFSIDGSHASVPRLENHPRRSRYQASNASWQAMQKALEIWRRMLSKLSRRPRAERPWVFARRPDRWKRPGDTASLNAGRRWSNPRDAAVVPVRGGSALAGSAAKLRPPASRSKGDCVLPFAAVPRLRLESRSAVAVLQEHH